MYQISHINLINFRGNKEINLDFPDDQVTIIHGTNGSGKTTLLKVIHAMLSLNEEVLSNEKITEGNLVLFEKESKQKKVLSVKRSEDGNNYIWTTDIEKFEEFRESFSSLVFGVNRGITYDRTNSRVMPIDVQRMIKEYELKVSGSSSSFSTSSRIIEDITDYLNQQVNLRARRIQRRKGLDFDLHEKHLMLDNLSMKNVEGMLNRKYIFEKNYMAERVQNALFDTLAQVVASGDNNIREVPEDFREKLSQYRENLIELLSDLEGNELSNRIVSELKSFESGNNHFEMKGLITNLIYNMITELEKGKGLFNTANQLIDIFNEYLEKDKVLIIDELGTRIKTNNMNSHDIEKLSSGEKHLLSFLTLFIIEGSKRDVLMIDEPEISLNLEWQSKLLNMLSKFAPDSQIIVATHSPAIAEYNTNNLVEIE